MNIIRLWTIMCFYFTIYNMKMGYMYELHCPLNDTTMYIGQTSKSLKGRLRQHISKTKLKIERNKFLSKKDTWINNLIQL
jgi:hypothetical protein